MDATTIRELVAQVHQRRLSRRRFVEGMVGLGVTAPMAAQLLGSPAPAVGQPREATFTPTRRGGGGDLRILMWDGPTLLSPHFGRGLRDFTASRIFYEPLAAPTGEGGFVPILAEEMPSMSSGSVAKD